MKKFVSFLEDSHAAMMLLRVLLVGVIPMVMVIVVFAAPPGSPFNLGETLNPSCAPADPNCTVLTPAASGANSDITSMDALDQVGIGGAPTHALDVAETNTNPADDTYSLSEFLYSILPSANQALSALNQAFLARTSVGPSNTNDVGEIWGANVSAENEGTGTISGMVGLTAQLSNSGAATVGDMWNLWIPGDVSDGTVLSSRGAVVDNDVSGGTVDDLTGVYVNNDINGGTVNNRYGVRIVNSAGAPAGGDFGIYQESNTQDNFFAGKVGIGTSAPVEMLDIRQDNDADINLTMSDNTGADNPTIHFRNSRGTIAAPAVLTSADSFGEIKGQYYDGVAYQTAADILFSVDGTPGVGDVPSAIRFRTTKDGTASDVTRMTIKNDGAILINSPTHNDEELHIADNTSSDTAISMENSGFIFEQHVEDTNDFSFYIGSSESTIGYRIDGVTGNFGLGIDPTFPLHLANGAHVTAGGVWTDASSRNYKEHILDLSLEDALRTLMDLNPIRYQYRTEVGEEYLGFIAEDVPDLVSMNDRKSLSPMDIVAVLSKVVQQQQRSITELQNQQNDLKVLLCIDHQDHKLCQ